MPSFRVATRRADTTRGYEKTSTRISVEAVGIALLETRVEANAVAFPLQVSSNSKLTTFLLTTALQRRDDRFAAQIDLAAGCCPPIYHLLCCLVAFHFWLRIEVR